MSGAGSVRVTFEASGTGEMVEFARRFLEEQGYLVEKALLRVRRRETLGQLCARLGVHWKVASRRLRHGACPPHEAQRGARGRLVWVVSNEAVDAFLRMEIGTGRNAVGKLARAGLANGETNNERSARGENYEIQEKTSGD